MAESQYVCVMVVVVVGWGGGQFFSPCFHQLCHYNSTCIHLGRYVLSNYIFQEVQFGLLQIQQGQPMLMGVHLWLPWNQECWQQSVLQSQPIETAGPSNIRK